MTRLDSILRALQPLLQETNEHLSPADQDTVYRALLDHVRARRPESVGYLSQLPPPGEVIRDPREVKS